jgi:hypothetical protein
MFSKRLLYFIFLLIIRLCKKSCTASSRCPPVHCFQTEQPGLLCGVMFVVRLWTNKWSAASVLVYGERKKERKGHADDGSFLARCSLVGTY